MKELPRHKIIVLDGEGIPAIGQVEGSPSRTPSLRQGTSRISVVKQEFISLDSPLSVTSSLKRPRTLSEQRIKQEPIDLDNFESSIDVPHATIKFDLTYDDEHSAKRVKFEADTDIDMVIKIEDDEDQNAAERLKNVDKKMGEVAEMTEHEDHANSEEMIEEEMNQDAEMTEEDKLAIAEMEAEIARKRAKWQAENLEFYLEN
jgi:hypothetical protein